MPKEKEEKRGQARIGQKALRLEFFRFLLFDCLDFFSFLPPNCLDFLRMIAL